MNSLSGTSQNTTGSINFYSKLKEKRSQTILNEMLKFINTTFNEISENTNDPSDLSVIFQDFVSKFVNEFARTWEIQFTNIRNAYVEICEGFESLIMKSLYPKIMTLIGDDGKLDRLCRKFTFVSLKHLGIDCNVDEFELATQIKSKILILINLDFCELTQYRSPKEKANVIVNFCNYICSKYKLTDKANIIKFIVFCILKSNITNLKAHVKFIGLFRHKTSINSEEDYFLSLVFQSIEFIERMNSSHLKIKKSEFNELCDEFEKKELLRTNKSLKSKI
jgi:hypothetical protein